MAPKTPVTADDVINQVHEISMAAYRRGIKDGISSAATGLKAMQDTPLSSQQAAEIVTLFGLSAELEGV